MRVRRLVFIVVNAGFFLAAAGWLVSGMLDHLPVGTLVVLSAVVVILGGGVALRIWIYLRLRRQFLTTSGDGASGSTPAS